MIWAIILAPFLIALWWKILQRWQRGIRMLLVYMPFAGVVTLALYPSVVPLLFKDLFFVIPTFVAALVSKRAVGNAPKVQLSVFLFILALTTLVVIQMFNPNVFNWLVALIGAKVWLMYLPMLFLGFRMIETQADLVSLLRLMVAISWIPCGIGLFQWISSIVFGYEATMALFYGAAAGAATQGFASFDVGGTFFRIPSTFTFVTQYFGFTLAMIPAAYALSKLDPSPRWQVLSNAAFWFTILASFLSGSRSAYLFVPILLIFLYAFDGRISGLLQLLAISPLVLIGALYFGNIDPYVMFDLMVELTTDYSRDIAYKGLADAIQNVPWGLGTGMNTGAARYGLDEPELFEAFENFYAKVVYELGVVGLVIVASLFTAIVARGWRTVRQARSRGVRGCAAALLAFIVMISLNSFKGWILDIDPINVYFWLFVGIMLKLEYLPEPEPIVLRATATGAPIGARTRPAGF